jgi:hypothetical protein
MAVFAGLKPDNIEGAKKYYRGVVATPEKSVPMPCAGCERRLDIWRDEMFLVVRELDAEELARPRPPQPELVRTAYCPTCAVKTGMLDGSSSSRN